MVVRLVSKMNFIGRQIEDVRAQMEASGQEYEVHFFDEANSSLNKLGPLKPDTIHFGVHDGIVISWNW